MPQALYGANMTVTALVLKIDFFRAVLSRKRLSVLDQQTNQPRLINQERELVYFCDEFASIASTGDTTGEAGFLDKCREYKCSVVLGLQSIPMLLKKFTEGEVDAILTNCANKIFLRNSDKRTNAYAEEVSGSKRSLSVSFKASGTEAALDNKASIGARNFSTSLSSGKLHDAGSFPKLKDGECVIRLNPRFGKNQVQKTQLNLHLIKTPEPKDLFPFPEYKV
jgi:type IV secretory pathway TraG/TraD family ATPase VirD4